MKRRLKIKLSKLALIICCWVIVGILISLYDHFLLSSNLTKGYNSNFSFRESLVFNIIGSFAGSVIGGVFLVFYVNEKYQEKSYGFSLLAVLIAFFTTVALIIVIFGFASASGKTGKPLTDAATIRLAISNIINPVHLRSIIVWGTVVAITQLMLSIDFKFGYGVLWRLIRGKYHRPREENRIFMFLDISASTTIAEKLGDKKYHALLKDFFADITNPILDNRGEIYQYVGDEIVISWKLENGITNSQCLKCYFAIRKTITDLKEKYISKYNLLPDFKAGLHYGTVIAGEIGIIKRDITFSGNVLNAASRIQSKCNEYNVKILSSDELLQILPYDNHYRRIPVGDIALKGKENKMALSTLEMIV